MARLARAIATGIPHHITQRASGKRFILESEAERKVYLDLLRQGTELHGVPGNRLLSDVEPCPHRSRPSQGSFSLADAQGGTWPIRILLERSQS